MAFDEVINCYILVVCNRPSSLQCFCSCDAFFPLHFPRQLHEIRKPCSVFHSLRLSNKKKLGIYLVRSYRSNTFLKQDFAKSKVFEINYFQPWNKKRSGLCRESGKA